MSVCRNKGLTTPELKKIVSEGVVPSEWDFEIDRITEGLLHEAFAVIDELGLPANKIISFCSVLTNRPADVEGAIRSPSNLRRRVKGKVNRLGKGASEVVFEELYQGLDVRKSFPGPVCERLGISYDDLSNLGDRFHKRGMLAENDITNEFILELNKAREVLSAAWVVFDNWYSYLSGNENHSTKSLHLKVLRLKEKYSGILKNRKEVRAVQLSELFRQSFLLSTADASSRPQDLSSNTIEAANSQQYACVVNNLLDVIKRYEDELHNVHSAVRMQEDARYHSESEIMSLRQELARIKKAMSAQGNMLNKQMSKLGEFSTRNVNKKLKRRDEKIREMKGNLAVREEELKVAKEALLSQTENMEHANKSLQSLQEEVEDTNRRLDQALSEKLRAQKLKSYYKVKGEKVKSENEKLLRSKLLEMEEEIKQLQHEKLDLEHKLEEFLQGQEVQTFKNGVYSDSVRKVYEDLLCLGIGTKNVETVIRKVLKELAGVECGRLPKATFAKYMLLEARGIAQIHVAEELLADWEAENRTLHSDGTSKFGHSYLTYDIVKENKQSLMVGLREVASGDAESQLSVFKDVLQDIVEMTQIDKETSAYGKIVKSVKNLMSDRCATQKKFNQLFTEFRSETLPLVINNWNDFDKEEKKELGTVHEFFCGLHFLVALADQAESSLKVWDTLCFGKEKVGSLAHGGYSTGDSGTLRLIRSVCKAIQERGSEKSGKMVQCRTFLMERGIASVPLIPFKGNRFNVLFKNGAGLASVANDLTEFFKIYKVENKLLTACYHDITVSSFIVGTRALGLIDKIVTGPLWRILVKDRHILCMNNVYQKLLHKCREWAEDATPFLLGRENLFDDDELEIERDMVYTKLVSGFSDEWYEATKQCLELMFGGFVGICHRLLHDHLSGGIHERKDSEKYRQETSSVGTSNVGPERNFGMLDRLMLLKPKATDLVLEGVTMFVKNDVPTWRDTLPPEKLHMVMEMARKSKSAQRLQYLKRKDNIRKEKAKKLKEKEEKQFVRERKARLLRQDLLHNINEIGGLWTSPGMIKDKLDLFGKEQKKREALRTQILFRQKVLRNVHEDRAVFKMSAAGVLHNSGKLEDNLIKIIAKAQEESDTEDCASMTVDSPIVISKEEFVKQKQILREKAINEEKKVKSKRKSKQQSKVIGAKRRRSSKPSSTEPSLCLPEDLVGKKCEHMFIGDDGDEHWYDCVVLSKGRGINPWFKVRYEADEKIYQFKLMNDLENGELRLRELTAQDFIDAEILHLYTDEETQEDSWWKAVVVDVDEETEESPNPDFFLHYPDEEDEEEEDCEPEYYLVPLLEDYLNGWVRFL